MCTDPPLPSNCVAFLYPFYLMSVYSLRWNDISSHCTPLLKFGGMTTVYSGKSATLEEVPGVDAGILRMFSRSFQNWNRTIKPLHTKLGIRKSYILCISVDSTAGFVFASVSTIPPLIVYSYFPPKLSVRIMFSALVSSLSSCCAFGVCVWVLERISITGKQLSNGFWLGRVGFLFCFCVTGYENNLTLPIPIVEYSCHGVVRTLK